MTPILETGPGWHDTLGAAVKVAGEDGLVKSGVNFALFSYHATEVDLLFFEHPDATQPSTVLHLDPETNRTGAYWHIFVPELEAGQLYGYRLRGTLRARAGTSV